MEVFSRAFSLRPHMKVTGLSLCGRILFVLLFFILSFAVLSCSNAEDSAKKTLVPVVKNKADSVFIEELLEHAWEWQAKNPDSCYYYATHAFQLAKEKGFPLAEAEANCRFGNLEEAKGSFTAALDHYYSALTLDSAGHNTPGIARDLYLVANLMKKTGHYAQALYNTKRAIIIWQASSGKEIELGGAINNLGNIYMREGKVDSALLYFQQSDSIALKINSLRLQAEAINSIGLIYEVQHRYDKAMEMYQKSLAIEQKRTNKRGIAIASNNIGNIYYLQGNLSESLEWYQRSIQLKKEINYTQGAAGTLTNIGSIYEAQGNLDEALVYHRKSYQMQSESGEQQEIAISANNIGLVLHRLGREQEAISYFELARDIAHKTGGKIIELEILHNLSESAASSGNYPLAFNYTRLHQNISDTIDESIRKANEMDALYQEEQNQHKLLQKENEKEHAELQRNSAIASRRETMVYALIAGIFLLILLFLALWRINREKHRVIIAEHQERINRQQTEDIIRNQELIVLRSIFDAQEKERQRIAKDLHDRLGLKLSTARLYYNLVGKLAAGMNEEERKQYNNGNNILNEASNELREVAHNLISGEIMRFGLISAVERLCETLQEASELKLNFYSSGLDNRIDSYSEFQIYQIIQELLTNIHRHAKARHVTIQFSRYNHTLNILVEDDGKGFPEKEERSEPGMGLKNIRERVLKLNGSLQIDSKSERGTTINIDITIP